MKALKKLENYLEQGGNPLKQPRLGLEKALSFPILYFP